jgi:hypothetical protein
MNTGTIVGLAAIILLIIGAIGYTAWCHRPKPVKTLTLEEEIQMARAEAIRLRISYEGEAEYAEAMASYQNRRAARLDKELEQLLKHREEEMVVKAASEAATLSDAMLRNVRDMVGTQL